MRKKRYPKNFIEHFIDKTVVAMESDARRDLNFKSSNGQKELMLNNS
jgi:hypothetical protein